MGLIVEYYCKECEQDYKISEGCGMSGRYLFTFVCLRCKKLNQMSPISEIYKEYGEVVNLDKVKSELQDESNKTHKCSQCRKKDQLVVWDREKKDCPKCGKTIESRSK